MVLKRPPGIPIHGKGSTFCSRDDHVRATPPSWLTGSRGPHPNTGNSLQTLLWIHLVSASLWAVEVLNTYHLALKFEGIIKSEAKWILF